MRECRLALPHSSSGTYSAISSKRQSSTAHNLFNVFVSMLSFARKRRTVLLSIPHFSLSW